MKQIDNTKDTDEHYNNSIFDFALFKTQIYKKCIITLKIFNPRKAYQRANKFDTQHHM